MVKKVDIEFVYITASTARQIPSCELNWSDIHATEIRLNPISLNRYFDNLFNVDDIVALGVTKPLAEIIGLSDQQKISLQRSITETIGFVESMDMILAFQRNFSDSLAVSDLTVLTVEKEFSEAVALIEQLDISSTRQAEEDIALTEACQATVTKAVEHSATVIDALLATIDFERDFDDSFTLNDFMTREESLLTKEHDFGLIDSQAFTFTKSPSGTSFILADEHRFSLEHAEADSALLVENLHMSFSASNNAVLNSSALNSFTLNS